MLTSAAALSATDAEEQLSMRCYACSRAWMGAARCTSGRRRALRTRPEITPLLSFTFTVRKSWSWS